MKPINDDTKATRSAIRPSIFHLDRATVAIHLAATPKMSEHRGAPSDSQKAPFVNELSSDKLSMIADITPTHWQPISRRSSESHFAFALRTP
jgi:hypothetical protein